MEFICATSEFPFIQTLSKMIRIPFTEVFGYDMNCSCNHVGGVHRLISIFIIYYQITTTFHTYGIRMKFLLSCVYKSKVCP